MGRIRQIQISGWGLLRERGKYVPTFVMVILACYIFSFIAGVWTGLVLARVGGV